MIGQQRQSKRDECFSKHWQSPDWVHLHKDFYTRTTSTQAAQIHKNANGNAEANDSNNNYYLDEDVLDIARKVMGPDECVSKHWQ